MDKNDRFPKGGQNWQNTSYVILVDVLSVLQPSPKKENTLYKQMILLQNRQSEKIAQDGFTHHKVTLCQTDKVESKQQKTPLNRS